MKEGYTASKRRAMRWARREAVKRGLALKRFQPGPDERDPPEIYFADDVRGRGWCLLTYSGDDWAAQFQYR